MTERYLYLGRSQEGLRSSGILSADSWNTAATELLERGLTLTFLERHQSVRSYFRPAQYLHRVPVKARRSFYQAFGTLLAAGCSFTRSLEICIDRSDSPAFREALIGTRARVGAGRSLSDALSGMPREFPTSEVALIRAGEKMGRLDETLLRLSKKIENSNALREQVVAAIAYPAWVFLASLAIVAFLALSTLPSVVALLHQLGVRPSGMLALSIFVSTALEKPGNVLWLVPALVVAIVVSMTMHSRAWVKTRREEVILRLPILGKIFADQCAGEFFSTCGDLLDAGVGIMEAIALGADATQNGILQQTARSWIAKIGAGERWSSSMAEGAFIDRMSMTMTELGEETGALPQLLRAIGEHRVAEAAVRLRLLTSFVEPAAMFVVGCMVALFVSGVLVPIYNAIGGIR